MISFQSIFTPQEIAFWVRFFRFLPFLAALIAVEVAWLNSAGFSINEDSLMGFFGLIYSGFILFFTLFTTDHIMKKNELFFTISKKIRIKQISYFFIVKSIVLATLASLLIFQYLSVAISAPTTIDKILINIDQLMLYNWQENYKFVNNHMYLKKFLSFMYHSLEWQVSFLFFILCMLEKYVDIIDFIILFSLGLIVFCIIGIFIPATSQFILSNQIGDDSYTHFHLLRSGSMKIINLKNMQGLLEFPSFHVVVAVLLTYSFRSVSWAFPFALILNFFVVVSTTSEGGHNLIDVVTGLLFSFLLIAFSNSFLKNTERSIFSSFR